MLIGSECELTLALGYDNPSQKSLSETMLKQEEIFRNQVFELHRLYQTQKILMKDLEIKVGSGENSHPFVGCFSKYMKCEYVATEMKLHEDRKSMDKQLRPLDLNLAASHCSNNDEDLLPKNGCSASRISSKMRYEADDHNVSSMDDHELSLSADSRTYPKQCSKGKDICSQSQQALCLQESPGGNLISQPAVGDAIHIIGTSGKYDAFGRILESSPLTNGEQKLEENKYFNQGIKRRLGNIEGKTSSVKRKLFACLDVEQLDLNKPIPDESFDHSIDHWIPSSSKVSSIDTSHDGGGESGESTFLNVHCWKELMENNSNEPSMLDPKDAENSTLTTSPNKSMGEQNCGSVLTSVDRGSICGSPSESTDLVGCSGNFKPKNAGWGMNSFDKTCQKILTSKIHDKKNKVESLHSSHSSEELLEEAADSNKSPVSCKSWTTDDESSNTRTGQRATDMSNSDLSLVQQNVEPSVGMKARPPGQQNEDMVELDDVTVRKGAVSLVYLSMERSTSGNKEQAPLHKDIKERCATEKEMQQSSSESYESLVLNQLECNPDEYCVSSMAFEATCLNEKDCGVKVRRGRRMKDFRKEILPSLAALSRQEINEDVKVMELAIRSREYRKHKAKNNNKIGSFSPVKNRKSRISRVGRRFYS